MKGAMRHLLYYPIELKFSEIYHSTKLNNNLAKI